MMVKNGESLFGGSSTLERVSAKHRMNIHNYTCDEHFLQMKRKKERKLFEMSSRWMKGRKRKILN